MKNFNLQSSVDSLKLGCTIAEPEGKPKGIFQLVHGMCEHKERYFELMYYLAGKGYVCVIHDHRGHGESVRSSEDLGYMYEAGWMGMVEDVKTVNRYIKSLYPDLPLTLLGHSMGSMVVRSYAKRYADTIDNLIVCGCPSDNPLKGVGKALAAFFGRTKGWHYRPELIQKMSFGAYNKPFEKEGWTSAWVCSNPEILKAYHSDPLCQFIFTANGFYNLLGLMQDCYDTKGWIKADIPVYFISGAEDPCRISDKDLDKAVKKMRKAGYKNVKLKIYPGMRHEILNETNKQQVWEDLLTL